jgi:peptidoglycan hydrolase-like protein with peptidoglycan-binding domain
MKNIIISFVISLSLMACASAPVSTPPAPPASSAPIEENAALISEVQTLLNEKGYNAGSPDGIAGPKTRGAIQEFEKASNLPVDGLVDDALYAALKPGAGAPVPSNGNSTPGSATPAEQQLRAESAVFNKSGLQACLITGGATAVLTYLIKKDEGAAIAAAIVGCGVGIGANYYLQQRRKEYASDEQRLEQMIADVRADNERLGRIIASAEEVVSDDKKKIDSIDRAYKQKQITMEQARQQMQSVDDNREYLEQTLANLKKREADWLEIAEAERGNQSSADMAGMDQEIGTLQNQIAALESDLEILVNRRSVSPIG